MKKIYFYILKVLLADAYSKTVHPVDLCLQWHHLLLQMDKLNANANDEDLFLQKYLKKEKTFI